MNKKLEYLKNKRPKQVAKLLKNINSNNQINRIMEAKTEKIRVMISREEVRDLEITFPYYTKNGSLYCKFLSKNEAVWVYDFGFSRAIKYSNLAVPENWLTFDPITEEEFNAKFKEVMTALIDINNEKTV